jgi:hypothetical protein
MTEKKSAPKLKRPTREEINEAAMTADILLHHPNKKIRSVTYRTLIAFEIAGASP